MQPNKRTNLYELIDGFRTFATDHYQINSFAVGPMSEVDVTKLSANQHPLLHVTPGTTVLDEGTITMDLDIIVATMQPPSEDQRTAVLSNQLYIMKDVVAWLKHHLAEDEFRGRVTLELPVTCEPFTRRFDNLLVGWAATVSLEWNNQNDLCLVPGL